jgi:hypothetical protein
LFVTGTVGSVRSSNGFGIAFIRLFITGRDTKPSLLIKRALKRAVKRIV